MFFNYKILAISSALLIATVACTPKANRIDEQVQQTIVDNKEAENITDWQSSEGHPERLFALWNQELIERKVTSAMVCKTLSAVPAEQLTLFEEQIKDPANQVILKDCKQELIEILESYWKEERTKLKDLLQEQLDSKGKGADSIKAEAVHSKSTSRNSPSVRDRFEEVIIRRDTTKGYFTRGAELANYQVLLTFDDGPHETNTDIILRTMDDVNAKALFFHMGKHTRQYPEIVRRVARDKHSIGSHSNSHACLPMKERCRKNNGKLLTHEQALKEIRGGHQALWDVLGWVDPFFRFPYGESSLELKRFLADHGVGEFYWSIDTEDWKAKSPSQLVIDAMTGLRKAKKGNILFHDVQRRTAEALPTILQLMLAEGYQTVTLLPEDINERTRSRLVK